MPLYEYECEACGRRFELIRKFADPPVEVCTLCGKGPVNRLFSSPAIQFKGSGFYITDYAKKGEAGKSAGGKTDSTSETTKSDSATASTGTKTDTKSESAAKSDSSAASAPAKTSGPARD